MTLIMRAEKRRESEGHGDDTDEEVGRPELRRLYTLDRLARIRDDVPASSAAE